MSSVKGRDFFGPRMWGALHSISAKYTPDKADSFVTLLNSMTVLLPCDMCGKHMKKKLEDLPPGPYLKNNHDTFLYLYTIHDLANKHINKYHKKSLHKISPPFDELKEVYFNISVNDMEEDSWFSFYVCL